MIEDLHKQRAAQSDTTLGVVSSGPGEAHPPGQSGEPPAEMSIREIYGHRIRTIDGEDWCVACGGSPSLWEECRPGAPRCDFCETAPADFSENGRKACSTGRCLAEARRAA